MVMYPFGTTNSEDVTQRSMPSASIHECVPTSKFPLDNVGIADDQYGPCWIRCAQFTMHSAIIVAEYARHRR